VHNRFPEDTGSAESIGSSSTRIWWATALGLFRRLYWPVFPSKLSRLLLEAPSPSLTTEASSPSPLEVLSLSPTAETPSRSLSEELNSLQVLSPRPTTKALSLSPPGELSSLEAPSLSPAAKASSLSPPEILSSLEASSPSPTAKASSLSQLEELSLFEELSSLEVPSPSASAEVSSPSPTAEASSPSLTDSMKVTFDTWITCPLWGSQKRQIVVLSCRHS